MLTNEQLRGWGEARLAMARQARESGDWEQAWQAPRTPWTFSWGSCWRQSIEYVVADFAAELGFYLDGLGLECNALDADFAMVNSPDQAFFLSFVPATAERPPTPPDALRVMFMLADPVTVAAEWASRGLSQEQAPTPMGGPMVRATFRTPAGIALDIWGQVSGPGSGD